MSQSYGSGFGVRSRPHVWHQQGKVTPFAGVGGYSSYSSYYGYRHWVHPQTRIDRNWALQMDLCRQHAPATVADAARMVTGAKGCSSWTFRVVDAHGKQSGPRLRWTGKRIIDTLGYDWFGAVDERGREQWLRENTRVRAVDRQPEDPHSAACRALKAQWRLTRNDNKE